MKMTITEKADAVKPIKPELDDCQPGYTPGPWIAADVTLAESLPHRWICGCGSDQAVIIQQAARIAERKESLANARLIAAAPELLEALEAMLKADDDICENRGLKSDQAMQRIAAIDQARAAIQKAKGGQS